MGLLGYQGMSSLRDVDHDGVLCTFSNRLALYSIDRGKWCGPSGQAAWTVHHVQNHTLLGHSPPGSQAGRRVGPALYTVRCDELKLTLGNLFLCYLIGIFS